MVNRRIAVGNFLGAKARPDIAIMWTEEMEIQVNVAQGSGERVEGIFQGRKWTAWTDGHQTWKSYRIPFNANTKPHYTDIEIKFNLDEHCEAIGMTGWNWTRRVSQWVAYDFDAIVGHSDKHEATLSDAEIEEVTMAACEIPWVTVRKSTSGNGLHLYVLLDSIETANHTEHAALARSILSKMSATTGFDFNSKVDNCGGNMWVWHKRQAEDGYEVIKQGIVLADIPINWRDHIAVTKGNSQRVAPGFVGEKDLGSFDQLCGSIARVPLDEQHKALFEYLDSVSAMWWFNQDHHMMVCHTADLLRAHETLGMRGIYTTDAQGGDQNDQNAYAFPLRNGAWVVRRHTPGVAESVTWDQDNSGWTRCYLNRDPDINIASRTFGGLENAKGQYVFERAEMAVQAAEAMGIHMDVPPWAVHRRTTIQKRRDGKLIIEMGRETNDIGSEMTKAGFIEENTKWQTVSGLVPTSYEQELGNFDDVIRHLSTASGSDAGWVFQADGTWKIEPLNHLKMALKSLGNSSKDAELVLGQAIIKAWSLVNHPFQDEYPGDRLWNRDSAQFALTPTLDLDDLKFDTWLNLLNHCGKALGPSISENKWCCDNGITTGGDYLKLWVASIFQFPFEPLPYLFMYGDQSTGKSTFHEALNLLIKTGLIRADTALINPSGFNGELAGAVLCVVEETDLRQNRSQAYNRIKDWTTGQTISIHIKGATPYMARNSTHWIQCSNEFESCPVFPGDTRITMIRVDAPEVFIAKRDLMKMLANEAADFLAHVMSVEIPNINDRLKIPILHTEDKIEAEKANQNEVERFIEDDCFIVEGEMILLAEFYTRFYDWLDPLQRLKWTKRRMGQFLPKPVVKGRYAKEQGRHYVANVCFTKRENGRMIMSTEGILTLTDGSKIP